MSYNNKAKYYQITIQADPNSPGGIYDYDMCIKSFEDLEEVFLNHKERLIAFLLDDLKTTTGKQLYIVNVSPLTDDEAFESYDLSNEANWPVFGAKVLKGSRRRCLPKLEDGAVKGHGGHFEVTASHDPYYPGVDVEFHVRGNTSKFDPRVVVEQAEGDYEAIRVLVWADPDSEDYTDKIVIDLSKWKEGDKK